MRPYMHRIHGAEAVAAFSAATKFDTRWRLLSSLRDIGRQAAEDWLAANFDAIGARSTMDLREGYARR
jgi:NTE family protein